MALDIDIIEGNIVKEYNGIVEEVTRVAILTGITGNSTNMLIEALSEAGMPDPGDVHPADSNLILGPRTVTPLGSVDGARVEMVYRTTTPILRGGASLSQITTTNDRNGDLIEVEYATPINGEKKIQTGEINPFNAEGSILADVLIQDAAPGSVALSYVNNLNISAWQGRPPYEWLCSNASFHPWASNANWWRFTFEFQHRPLLPPFDNAWDPEVRWVGNDGITPQDLVSGTGYKMIEWYDINDFNIIVPT